MGYKLKTHSSAKKRFKATGSGLKKKKCKQSTHLDQADNQKKAS